MLTTIWIIQIISAILLIIFVLLHSPKGGGIGAMGGMENLFASQKSAESGLNKLTMYIAIIFIVTTLITGYQALI